MDGAVAAHRQRLAQAVGGLGRPHREDDDLGGLAALDDSLRLLDGVLVQLGQPALYLVAVNREVVGETPGRGRLRNVLDRDDDLHERLLSSWVSKVGFSAA